MKLWITAIAIFIFAFGFRLWNLDMAGRWSDEQWYAEKSIAIHELLRNGNFTHPFWYLGATDHPPLSNYFYGIVGYRDLISYDPQGTSVFPGMPPGNAVFNYDLTNMRLMSAVVSSLAVVLAFLIGARHFSFFVGIASSMMLAMLPHYLGLSQFVVLETWIVFLFTACVFAYTLYLETNNKLFLVLTGILTGLCLLVKQSNVLIFAFYLFSYIYWWKFHHKKYISPKHLFQIGFIPLVVCIIVNPFIWFNLPAFLTFSYDLWFKEGGLIPEQVFGIRMGARFYFYIIAALVTTPVLLLILTILGIKVSWSNRKNWVYALLIIWFLVPFLMSFFHHRQHMVRYIIQFYVPLSLLAAIGLEYAVTRFTKSKIILYSFIAPIFVYLMIILYSISPYYLTYFNELVGGTKNVYEKQLFYIGWFGEGLRTPGKYLEAHAQQNATVGMAIDPELKTLYRSQKLKYEKFDAGKSYDYVVVNYFNVIRMGFDRKTLERDYHVVYTERTDGIELAWVYKHK